MAKLIKGDHIVTTDLPREIVDLKARGYRIAEAGKLAQGGRVGPRRAAAEPANDPSPDTKTAAKQTKK